MSTGKRSAADDFSFGKMAAYSLGAGVLVLIIAVPIVFVVAQSSATAALIVACGAVIVMITAIGIVSRRMLAGVQAEIDRRREADGTK